VSGFEGFDEDDVLAGVDFARKDEQSYEDQVVACLINRYGLGAEARRRLRYMGDGQLTLQAFHELFPTFPCLLLARRWRGIQDKVRLVDFFGNFPKLIFVKAWEAARKDVGGIDGRLGLVFHWPYLKGQLLPRDGEKPAREPAGGLGLVLRNGDPDLTVPGVRVFCVSPAGERLLIEPFSVMLREIDTECGGEWQPNV